jgi:hypothetical protein
MIFAPPRLISLTIGVSLPQRANGSFLAAISATRLPGIGPERSRSDKQQRRMSPLGPSEPNASARSVGKVARLSGNVRQLNHLANEIVGHKAERRPGAGEEWLAATKNDGAEIKSILINKTKCG